MKKFICATLLAFSSYASATTITDFTGIFSVENFTKTLNGGSINTSSAPASVSLTSSNDGSFQTKNQDFTIASPEAFTISFDFSFQSTEIPYYDPFGFLLNNVFIQISDSSGPYFQTGSRTFEVAAGDVFGFRANSLDSVYGAATATISNFSAVNANEVPEPATVALVGLGLLGFAASRRKSAKNKNA